MLCRCWWGAGACASPEHRGNWILSGGREAVFRVCHSPGKIPHGRRLALKGVPLGWVSFPVCGFRLGGEPDKGDDQGEAEAENRPPRCGKTGGAGPASGQADTGRGPALPAGLGGCPHSKHFRWVKPLIPLGPLHPGRQSPLGQQDEGGAPARPSSSKALGWRRWKAFVADRKPPAGQDSPQGGYYHRGEARAKSAATARAAAVRPVGVGC